MKCSTLVELYFSGPNSEVASQDFSDLLSSCAKLEVLVADQQMSVEDSVLCSVSKASSLRKLSIAACYSVSDEGVASLSVCSHLRDMNLSYCHQVGDKGVAKLTSSGVLYSLTARGLPLLTDRGLLEVVKVSVCLKELDISGCIQVSDQSLYALQENLLHMRGSMEVGSHDHTPEPLLSGHSEASGDDKSCTIPFSITLGGTSVSGEVAMKFTRDTGALVCLHDLSSMSLQQPHFDFAMSLEEEDMLREEELCDDFKSGDGVGSGISCGDTRSHPTGDNPPGGNVDTARVYLPEEEAVPERLQRAYDWLEADDPALFSDNFSGDEDDLLF